MSDHNTTDPAMQKHCILKEGGWSMIKYVNNLISLTFLSLGNGAKTTKIYQLEKSSLEPTCAGNICIVIQSRKASTEIRR
jgi:hypothetical protein